MGWLDPLNSIELVIGSVLADLDGLVIESISHDINFDPQSFAVGMTSATQEIGALTEDLGDQLRRYMVTMEKNELVVICFGSYMLGTYLKRDRGRRDVRRELLRLAANISAELEEVKGGR